MMDIEIITTGDEVMNGVIVDTNTAWIAGRVSMLGHKIVRHSSVADEISDIGDALKAASKRASVVVVTGGLGPTSDDLTIEAAAKAFGVKLVLDKKVLEDIRLFFDRIQRPMSSSNEKQALIPESSIILRNRVGTAPGVQVTLNGSTFFFLPGVPKELYQIFDDSVMPYLSRNASEFVSERVLHCFGLSEAAIDESLKTLNMKNVRLSFRVKFPEVILKLVAKANDLQNAKLNVDKAANLVKNKLGIIIYGEGETSLAEVVGSLLRDRGMSIAVAESCTGGLFASMITDVPGSSAYFDLGLVTYSNDSKQELLNVTRETLCGHGAVSRETAMAMADGIKRMSNSSIGVGITGIAGPSGGTPEKPVGTVHIAVATPDGVRAHEFHFNRDRLTFKGLVVATALDLVRKYLL